MALDITWDRRMSLIVESEDFEAWTNLLFVLRKTAGNLVMVNGTSINSSDERMRWVIDLPTPNVLPVDKQERIRMALKQTKLNFQIQTLPQI